MNRQHRRQTATLKALQSSPNANGYYLILSHLVLSYLATSNANSSAILKAAHEKILDDQVT